MSSSSSSRNLDRCHASFQASGSEEQQMTMLWEKNPCAENIEAMITAGKYSQGRRRKSSEQQQPTSSSPATTTTQVSRQTPSSAQDTTAPRCYDGLRSCPPLALSNPHTFTPLFNDDDHDNDELPTIHIAKLCPIYTPGTPHLTRIVLHNKSHQYPPNTPHPQTLRRPAQLKRAPSIPNIRRLTLDSPPPKPHYASPAGKAIISQLRQFLSLSESIPPSTLLFNLLTKWVKIRKNFPKINPRLAKQFNSLDWWGVQFEVHSLEERRLIESFLG
ncbi:hypothetical protein QBC38DRAFT_496011 [Podospora fimiseda]|uniref:Uncharacterized protein n=1 Tax=Podospora fimiseda TaxID=252190 RepID=A0AAN7BWY4_9PEZI|nr:hypothetical protein QBC38DRAFT_496011 [Podospora fimiseda]